MPYADPEKKRAAQRESYRRRYEASRKFREEEAERKAAWLQTKGKAKNAASSARARAKKKAKKKPGKTTRAAAANSPETKKVSPPPGRSSRKRSPRARSE